MIYVGLDDTDVVGTPGTNQLARAILQRLGQDAAGAIICRHQLLFDPRVPFTSKNGSASIQLPALSPAMLPRLIGVVRGVARAWFIPGSDPGLCIAGAVAEDVVEFGGLCQREIVTTGMARVLAREANVYLEGLGGTEQGIIGALAAVGLIAGGNDGRVVQMEGWAWPDDFAGVHNAAELRSRGVQAIRRRDTGEEVTSGTIDIGNHLRPNIRGRKVVLLVEPASDPGGPTWRAVKLP